MRTRAPRRTVAALAVAVAVATVAFAGCTVPRPAGPGTVRYRDTVFPSATKTPDLTYGSAPDEVTHAPVTLKLDLFRPTGDTQTHRPALVWVHGGSFTGGDKSDSAVAQAFARLGYVAVSINYRLAPQACTAGNITPECFTEAIDAQHDAQAAVRWLRAHATTYGIDPTRIAVSGSSAGAIIATAVGTHSEDPGTSGNPGYASTVGAFSSFSGGLPGGLYAGAGDAPGLFVHGTADPVVPFGWSVDTAVALLRAGVPAFLEPLDGQGHTPPAYVGQLIQQSDYLFYASLDLAHAAGQPASARRAFDRQARRLLERFPRFAPAARARASAP